MIITNRFSLLNRQHTLTDELCRWNGPTHKPNRFPTRVCFFQSNRKEEENLTHAKLPKRNLPARSLAPLCSVQKENMKITKCSWKLCKYWLILARVPATSTGGVPEPAKRCRWVGLPHRRFVAAVASLHIVPLIVRQPVPLGRWCIDWSAKRGGLGLPC